MDFADDGRDRYRTSQHMNFTADGRDRYRTLQLIDTNADRRDHYMLKQLKCFTTSFFNSKSIVTKIQKCNKIG